MKGMYKNISKCHTSTKMILHDGSYKGLVFCLLSKLGLVFLIDQRACALKNWWLRCVTKLRICLESQFFQNQIVRLKAFNWWVVWLSFLYAETEEAGCGWTRYVLLSASALSGLFAGMVCIHMSIQFWCCSLKPLWRLLKYISNQFMCVASIIKL
jgi:hypothetical protein